MTVAWFSLLAAVVGGAVAGVSVGMAAARRTPDPRPVGASSTSRCAVHLVDLLVGAAAGGVGLVLALVVGRLVLGMASFGAFSVVYLFVVVGAPLAAAIVLGQAWLPSPRANDRQPGGSITRPAVGLCVAGLLLAPLGFYASRVEPTMLDVDRPPPVALAAERSGSQAITIGVLTDLQTPVIGDHERWVIDQLQATHPDVILIAGDVIQADGAGFAEQLPALHELFGRLSAPGGVYLVGGDVDQPLDRLPQIVTDTGVRYLDDEVVTTRVGDRTITIGGVGLAYASPTALATVEQLETQPGDDDIRILLAHRPDPALALRPDSRIDLQVSGHTHGGQISVPFVGPILTLTDVPRWVAAGGLHELGGNPIYVSHGVGLERGEAPQVRFGVRPNIGLLTLEG